MPVWTREATLGPDEWWLDSPGGKREHQGESTAPLANGFLGAATARGRMELGCYCPRSCENRHPHHHLAAIYSIGPRILNFYLNQGPLW